MNIVSLGTHYRGNIYWKSRYDLLYEIDFCLENILGDYYDFLDINIILNIRATIEVPMNVADQ